MGRLSYLEPPSWSSRLVGHSGFVFISVSGKITAENVMNCKVKREKTDGEERNTIRRLGKQLQNTQRSRRKISGA